MPKLPLVSRPNDALQHAQALRLEADTEGRFLDALRTVVGTPAGRLVLWTWIVERGGLYAPLHCVPDLPYVAGRRDLALFWREQLVALDPGVWALMEHEASVREQARQRAIREMAHSRAQPNQEESDGD